MSQIHKKFNSDAVKGLFERYLKKEIERKYLQDILRIKKRRFFMLLKQYRKNPEGFSIQYQRTTHPRLSADIERNLLKELSIDKQIIQDKDTPLRSYNYSYIRDRLKLNFHQKVSLPTIIDRAKKHGFYLKKPKKSLHDREVLTHYIGELIQHDSSLHLWAPAAQEKWYLIPSLDDFSRLLLYAFLIKKETSWAHIVALQTVILRYGLPYAYYVDSHSIFRFVQGRDSIWREHHLLTDEATPQWKQVLEDCNVKVIHSLSPQARGKIERPYGWLQDRLVRTCAREDVTDIHQAQRFLNQELHRYNHQQVHSTTEEIPYLRFQRALKEKQSLFREFSIRPPFQSVKDIFCLRMNRTVDPYRKISIHTLQLKVNHATPRKEVNLRIYPLNHQISEIRFWCEGQLIDVQRVKNSDFKGVHF